MTTVNDFTDILRIIREQPEWADALRAALLSKELLELPQRFAEFTEIANRRFAALESDVAELKAGQARLESDVAELKAGQARLEGDVAELKAGQSRLEGTVARLEGDVAELKEGQMRLDSAVSRLEGQGGNLRGAEYEIRVGKSISTTIGRQLNLMRVRMLKSRLIPENATLRDLMDTALEQATITEDEWEDFDNIDLVLRGRSIDHSTVYVVIEISVTAGDHDIIRAADRSETLRRATGETTFAAVVSANWDAPRQKLAEERGVAVVTKPEE